MTFLTQELTISRVFSELWTDATDLSPNLSPLTPTKKQKTTATHR